MGRTPLQPSRVGGQRGRARTEPAPGGLRQETGGLRQRWGGSGGCRGTEPGCRGIPQDAGCSGRVQRHSDRGLGGSPQSQSSLKFVAWCDRCQTLGSSHQQLWSNPWTQDWLEPHESCTPSRGDAPGTQPRAICHSPGTVGCPLPLHGSALPREPVPAGRVAAVRVLPPDGHLVPVPCKATALCARFDVLLLSPVPGLSFGGLREAVPGFGDGCRQRHRLDPRTPR